MKCLLENICIYNLLNLPINLAKQNAARSIYGDKYKILTEDFIVKLQKEELIKLHESGNLVLGLKYQDRLLKNRDNNAN